MRIIISLLILCIFCNQKLTAQPIRNYDAGKEKKFEYYLQLSGFQTRAQIENLQNNITGKDGVKFFFANRYPVRYFLLESSRSISPIELSGWIGNRYQLTYLGEGVKGREEAIVKYNKTKAHL